MRTYDRATYQNAKAAWDSGDFGPEWTELRRLCWERGFPYPPTGTRWDDVEEGEQSQRAIIFRALHDRPVGTRQIVEQAHNWSFVVAGIIGAETRLREDAGLVDREAEYDRAERPTHREAVMSIASVLRRIDESRP